VVNSSRSRFRPASKGFSDGRGDRLDAGQRRGVGARRGLDGVARELEKCRGVRQVDLPVARAHRWAPLADHDAGELQRRRQDVLRVERVEQAGVAQLLRGDGGARHDHVQGGLDADEPRQALCAAGARQETELDLGQRDLRARDGDAVMTGQREFEAAAHADAVDAGNHGLLEFFDRANERQ